MKISYNWLKEYISLDLDPHEVAGALTSAGLEVEDVIEWESVKGGLKGIVIGEVLTCQKHPNADKLSVTTVHIGNGTILPIVCGASNVASGQKVVVATPGTMIHKGQESFEIKKAKIRGEVSEGMICAEDEIGLGDSHEGIMVLPGDVQTGLKASDYFGVEHDVVFEIGLTPNRSDAASHIGVARDLVAALNFRTGAKKYTLNIPETPEISPEEPMKGISISVEDNKACPRYSGITLSGLRVGPSPQWLQNRLQAIGIRPINNVVDVTNFVMFETGQPLHAFDVQAIEGNHVVVRKLPENTAFVTLDGVERKLNAEDLMICNLHEPMCIAGVFGGLKSGVTAETTSIFLESACFHSRSVRRTSRNHSLQTDASFRFERGSDPEITVYALKRASGFLLQIAGGYVSSPIGDIYPEKVNPAKIRLSYNFVHKIAGQEIEPATVKNILSDLGILLLQEDKEGLEVEVPAFKTDVTRPADLVEEILRIYGYDNILIPDKINASVQPQAGVDKDMLQNKIADMLSSNGFFEVMNNSLSRSAYSRIQVPASENEQVFVLNPLSSELDVMRQTLLFGGLETIAYNQNRKLSDMKLFEIGKIYRLINKPLSEQQSDPLLPYREEFRLDLFLTGQRFPESWRHKTEPFDFYDIRYYVDAVFHRLGIKTNQYVLEESNDNWFDFGLHYTSGGSSFASFGKLNTQITKHFDIKKDVFYATLAWETLLQVAGLSTTRYNEVPKFPAVRRDLALVLEKHVSFDDVKKIARESEPYLLSEVNLFDVYEGDKIPQGKKSYAVSFIILDKEKTLTDKIIDQVMGKILRQFEQKLGASLR
jgi:phenylalanyl-tRNA synthetase beta chain